MKRFVLEPQNHSEHPVIQLRLDYYDDAVKHGDWASHNLINTRLFPTDTKYGHMAATWGVHTFHKLIPPSVYFEDHPEYFAVHKGKRSDKTQLCLSNEEMREELTKNLLKVISDNPGYWCYDVSQNDNRQHCECLECEDLEQRYGGHSGAIIWFVNQIADEVKKTFPQVLIGTLAYSYTRQAPTSDIHPADNVVVKLCDIECCMAHPLNGCEKNKDFLRDMDNWKRITKNIYVWDYTTGFRNYLLPFPNFDTLAKNYQYFSQSNVIGVLELGSWDAPWNEFSELKQWLIAKLLWNPYQDTDSLATIFINDYYGKAAPFVRQYYELCKRQVTNHTHFTVQINWESEIFTDRFVTSAIKLLERAVAASGDNETLKRTNRLMAQAYYLKLRRQTGRSLVDGTTHKLSNIINNDNTIYKEHGGDIDQLIEELTYY